MLNRALQSSSLRGALCVRALRPVTTLRPCARVLRPVSVLKQSGRWCSTKAEEPPAESKPADDKPMVLFEGAKNKLVMHLKMVSIGNLGLAITTTPVLQYVAGAKGMLMSGLFLTFGGGTTAALTWATSTYVLSVTSIPGRNAMLIKTPTLFGGVREREVEWSDITRPIGYHPFSTFEAAGAKYYLDELGTMHDETFPEKLESAINA